MVGDVAVEHPVPRIVGDEADVRSFTRRDEDRAAPLAERVRLAVAGNHPEGVAVKVHRVPPCRIVAQGEHAALAFLHREERRHIGLTIAGHRHAIHRPGSSAPTNHAHPAHHAALEQNLVPNGAAEFGLGQWVCRELRRLVWWRISGWLSRPVREFDKPISQIAGEIVRNGVSSPWLTFHIEDEVGSHRRPEYQPTALGYVRVAGLAVIGDDDRAMSGEVEPGDPGQRRVDQPQPHPLAGLHGYRERAHLS
jgi:hypothetical protein